LQKLLTAGSNKMDAQVSVRLIGSRISDGTDVVIFSEALGAYDPAEIGEAVVRVIERCKDELAQPRSYDVCLGDSPQISIIVSMLGDFRPVVNFSKEVIRKMSEINASFDFDPYF
jgi:hypothetical protein